MICRNTLLIICIIVFISDIPIVSGGSSVIAADIQWQDDFDDGNDDGWILSGVKLTSGGDTETWDGNFQVNNGILNATGSDENPYWNLASHESTMSIGMWSFDVYVVDVPWTHIHIYFMTDDWNNYPNTIYGYDIMVITEDVDDPAGGSEVYHEGFLLVRRNGEYDQWVNNWKIIANYEVEGEVAGWYNLNITRSSLGEWNVYINDTLRMSVVDTTVDTSSYFRFITEGGPAFDNVIVSGNPGPLDTTTTTLPSGYGEAIIVMTVGFGAIIVVIIIYVIKRRSKG